MRLLPLAFLLLCASADAQAPEPLVFRTEAAISVLPMPPAAPGRAGPDVTSAESALIAAGGVAGTFVGTLVLLAPVEHTGIDELYALIPAALVASSASVYGLGALLGNDGSLTATVGGAAAGLLPSAGLLIAERLDEAGDSFGYHVTAFLLGAVLAPVAATVGYSLVPTSGRTPTGEPAPGLALRARF